MKTGDFMAANQAIIELVEVRNSCFVAMPFDEKYRSEFEKVIQPAIKATGLECVRGDEIYAHQAIVHDIWKSLRESLLLVAELSDRNPNVMYEIGLAHAIGKPVILLTRNERDVPFDLRALRYLFYDTNNPSWGDDLRKQLTKMIEMVVNSGHIATYLEGVTVKATMPPPPNPPEEPARVPSPDGKESPPDVSGIWAATWISIKRNRRHTANLVIPAGHGAKFTATMTVAYEREGDNTVVQEWLDGSIRERRISLTGVSYTYIRQGGSRSYLLDAFTLTLDEGGLSMKGQATLRHGIRDVIFQKTDSGTVPRPAVAGSDGARHHKGVAN
jgi:hypothetical protein